MNFKSTVKENIMRFKKEWNVKQMFNFKKVSLNFVKTSMVCLVLGLAINTTAKADTIFFSEDYWTTASIKSLKEHRGNVGVRDTLGNTMLMAAAKYNANPNVIQYLFSEGANLDEANKRGKTALMLAARYNNYAVVEMLLNLGANVGSLDDNGSSALMWASWGNKDLNVVKVLLNFGAKVNVQDVYGQTALMWASWYNNNVDIIETLLIAGANPRLSDKYKRNAIYYMKIDPYLRQTRAYRLVLNAIVNYDK